jgi:hypothetical protein
LSFLLFFDTGSVLFPVNFPVKMSKHDFTTTLKGFKNATYIKKPEMNAVSGRTIWKVAS